MKRRIIAFLLASMMLVPMAACGKEETPDNVTKETQNGGNADTSADTEAVETEEPATLDDLPETLDFDGMTLGVVCVGKDGGGFDSLIGSEDTKASVMEQAKYDRYIYLKDRLSIDLFETSFHYDTMAEKTQALVMANDDTVDMVNWGLWRVFMFGLDGCLLSASQVPYIDQSKPYWAEDAREAMTLLGQQYALVGDFDTTRYSETICMLFNKTILENHNLTSPYELVDNDQWTFDTLLTMASTVHNDADSDGTPTAGDTIGMIGGEHEFFQYFHNAAGLRQISPDADGNPVFNVPGNEKFVDVWNWCRSINDSGVMMKGDAIGFAADLALFSYISFGGIVELRDMESDFGVVPLPKWNEDQDRYYTPSGGSAFGVLITAESKEAVGAYLEAGASYGHRKLIPLFYDNDLKLKLARDTKCAEMFDLILASSIYDLGVHAYLNVCNWELCKGFREDREFASLVKMIERSTNRALKNAVKAIEESLQQTN